jgi:16S rRNA (adenine1518-N6/adenine1519-N6)-dimethyltransferase
LVRLGQNFLADPNLLEAIVRDSKVTEADCVLEVGAGEGVLTERLAAAARQVHVIEIDRGLEPWLEGVAGLANVNLVWADAVRFNLTSLEPAPTAMVANLPYAVATPVIMRSIFELPSIQRWTVMVQREIADRLRAKPGTKAYGAPSVLAQLTGPVRQLRKVSRTVFRPPPRVDSSIISIEREGPGPDEAVRSFVRAAFSHRRKALPRSLDMAIPGMLEPSREALGQMGLDPAIRAEALSPRQLASLSAMIGARRSTGAQP